MSKKNTLEQDPSISVNKKKKGRIPFDVDDLRVQIIYHAPKALKDNELAKFLGISETTYYSLKATNSDFSECVNHYKRISPIEVLNSFKKRAIGFTFDEQVKELQKTKAGKYKLVVTKVTTKYYPPDSSAAYNYLKNQMPEQFKDKVEHAHEFNNALENITFVIKGKE